MPSPLNASIPIKRRATTTPQSNQERR
jgi:hypothetical protein